ncbi:hypothetical protein [Streptomyces bohaiensis]
MQQTPPPHPPDRPAATAAGYRALTVSTVLVAAPPPAPGGDAGDPAPADASGAGGQAAGDAYLRGLERHLRQLARRGGPVRLALFDPDDYLDRCRRTGADPDAPAVRAAYTGERAADAATVAYRGQPLDRALSQLAAAEHARRTWERCADLLAAAARCPRCGGPGAECAFQQAADTVTELLRRAGPGEQRLVCTLGDGAAELSATLRRAGGNPGADVAAGDPLPDLAASPAGRRRRGPGSDGEPSPLASPDGLLLLMVLAAALATGGDAGLLLRSTPVPAATQRPGPADGPGGGDRPAGEPVPEIRGWAVHGGMIRALSAAEAAAVHQLPDEPAAGAPGAPPGGTVVHRSALELPGYRCRPL